MPSDVYLSPRQAADLLGVSRYRVARLADRGELASISQTTERQSRVLILRQSVIDYAAANNITLTE